MRYRYLIVFLLGVSIIAGISAFRAPITYRLISKIPLESGSFTTDNLQNIYTLNGNVLKKYNSAGVLLCSHSDKAFGDITSMDVYDPMKILVYYKAFPQLVFLDNTLSQNGNGINPADIGYPLASMACISHDNGLWLYDDQTAQLVRLDVNLTTLQKTGSLNQLLGISVNPVSLFEYNNYVYLNDTTQGILIFDSFGTYYKTLPFTGVVHFEVRGDDVFYMHHHKLHAFHMSTITEDIIAQPDSLATQARVEKNLLYEKYRDTIRVYEIK